MGSPINVIYDYERIGLWNESDPDFQYLQQYEPGGSAAGMIKARYTGEYNADGSPVRPIGAEDRKISEPTPNFQGGVNTRLAYKNIDRNALTHTGAKTILLESLTKAHVQSMLSKDTRGRFLDIHEFTSLFCWLSSE